VSNHETPRVVIMGTGKTHNAEDINAIMSTVEPVLIPLSVLDSMYITFTDNTRVVVEKRFLDDGVDYKNIEGSLRKMGISANIKLVEIVVDLDKAYTMLQEKTGLILDPLFQE